MTRADFVVRPYETRDCPAIAALRDAYFAAHDQEVQVRDGAWIVCEHAGEIVGCQLSIDREDQRWQTDFYVAPGRPGIFAARALMDYTERDARAMGLSVLMGVSVDEKNLAGAYRDGWRYGGVLIFKLLEEA